MTHRHLLALLFGMDGMMTLVSAYRFSERGWTFASVILVLGAFLFAAIADRQWETAEGLSVR